jgi:hypothetical protein
LEYNHEEAARTNMDHGGKHKNEPAPTTISSRCAENKLGYPKQLLKKYWVYELASLAKCAGIRDAGSRIQLFPTRTIGAYWQKELKEGAEMAIWTYTRVLMKMAVVLI